MSILPSAKQWFLRTALSYLGTPYVWAGDDPSGFDCSGFVLECLKTVGVVSERDDLTADGLLRKFSPKLVPAPCEGALLFLLNRDGKATHVVICLDESFQIGASGGTKDTVDLRAAWRDNAYVKIRPIRFDATRMKVADPFRA